MPKNRLLNLIDDFLNRTTMYRLVLWILVALLAAAIVLSALGVLPYSPVALIASAALITGACWIANAVLARVFNAPTNVESVYITAFILALILTPPKVAEILGFLPLAVWASVWAMASKFFLAIGKKHVFNPTAFAVALTGATIGQSASWWIGTWVMSPLVLLGGCLIVRKIRRFDLVASFFAAALVSIVGAAVLRGLNPVTTFRKALLETPLLFFAFVMLTEPLTTPPTRGLRLWYGAITGFLFAPWVHVGPVYSTPELALLAGNVFSYAVGPKEKLFLKLKEKVPIASGTCDFIFQPDRKLNFRPGQYLEWTLAHGRPDARGNRRYFTIASSPTEDEIRMGVKFYPEPSSYKKCLQDMEPGAAIVASQLAGDFVMPNDKDRKLVFIAGGIGITPFRSMIKYLLDRGEKRPIILLYSNKHEDDIAYKDLLDEAERRLGIRTAHALTETDRIPAGWRGHRGMIDADMIMNEVPDFKERLFYLSGPHAMVTAFEETLKRLGARREQIKTDFFPGFA